MLVTVDCSLQGRDVMRDDVKDAILQLTVTEHYYTGVQDLVTLLCEFNDISVKVIDCSPGRLLT